MGESHDNHQDKNTKLHDHGQQIELLIQKMPDEKSSTKAADVFSFLCDSTRIRIIWLLCHSEECVTDIAAAVEMSAPAVSHHLRILRQANLLKTRRDGKEVLYTLEDTEEAQLVHKMVDDVFNMNCPTCNF